MANTGIGIAQEVRAKRALKRLAQLVAPNANVLHPQRPCVRGGLGGRCGRPSRGPGGCPGERSTAVDLRLDESILTGEPGSVPARRRSAPIRRIRGEGAGTYRVTAVGAASYAGRMLGEARAMLVAQIAVGATLIRETRGQ